MKGSPFQRNFGLSPIKDDGDEKKKVIEPPLTHEDTTTAGNPVNPAMIGFLGSQGFSKEEINVLHKHNEPGGLPEWKRKGYPSGKIKK